MAQSRQQRRDLVPRRQRVPRGRLRLLRLCLTRLQRAAVAVLLLVVVPLLLLLLLLHRPLLLRRDSLLPQRRDLGRVEQALLGPLLHRGTPWLLLLLTPLVVGPRGVLVCKVKSPNLNPSTK